MEVIGLVIASVMFLIAFLGLIYPIIPSSFVMVIGFLLYGLFAGFEELTSLFWVIQVLFLVLLFGADTLSTIVGVKKFGGSKAGVWGSTIGLLVGPFVIPVAGILLGPFLGAIIAQLVVSKTSITQSFKVGIGSVIGFLTSVITKGFLMIVMIAIFMIYIV